MKLSYFQEEMRVEEDSIKLVKKNNLKKKQIKENSLAQRAMCVRQACRPHTIVKKRDSVYRQAASTVDRQAHMSISQSTPKGT